MTSLDSIDTKISTKETVHRITKKTATERRLLSMLSHHILSRRSEGKHAPAPHLLLTVPVRWPASHPRPSRPSLPPPPPLAVVKILRQWAHRPTLCPPPSQRTSFRTIPRPNPNDEILRHRPRRPSRPPDREHPRRRRRRRPRSVPSSTTTIVYPPSTDPGASPRRARPVGPSRSIRAPARPTAVPAARTVAAAWTEAGRAISRGRGRSRSRLVVRPKRRGVRCGACSTATAATAAVAVEGWRSPTSQRGLPSVSASATLARRPTLQAQLLLPRGMTPVPTRGMMIVLVLLLLLAATPPAGSRCGAAGMVVPATPPP